MSVNHNHLKHLVVEMEQGTVATTKYSWLDLANEILRMRKELTDVQQEIRDVKKDYALDSDDHEVLDALNDLINQVLGENNE